MLLRAAIFVLNAAIGLASATSQLDRNAWQRVATYKSGSKQTWRRIFFVWNHIEKAQTDRTPAQLPLAEQLQPVFFVFFLQVQIPCYILSSCMCYVSGSPTRIAQCSTSPCTSPALLPWRRPVEANHLVTLGCSLCGGLFIAHSSWSLERENARNYETKTSSSYFDVEWFPCCLVRGRISAPVDRRLHDRNSPTLHTNLAQPPSSVQFWVSKLSKSCQHFLNLLVKEKQLWQVNVLSPRMPSYGTLSLFRTSFACCYAFPCISLGCDVSTCKPYSYRLFKETNKIADKNSFFGNLPMYSCPIFYRTTLRTSTMVLYANSSLLCFRHSGHRLLLS